MKIAYSILKNELIAQISAYTEIKDWQAHIYPTKIRPRQLAKIAQIKATIHSLKQAMKLIRKQNENRKR